MLRPFLLVTVTVALVARASVGGTQVAGNPEARDGSAERAARQAIRTFMTEWNAGEDARLRRVLHFPFVTVVGGGALVIDSRPEDFSQGFDQMRARDGWIRSAFDDDSYTVIKSSPDKVHAEIDFSRFGADGTPYMTSRVFYILTKQDGQWGIQLRTRVAAPADLGADERAEVVGGARQAVLDFFTAFNGGDVEGTVKTLNHPHLFMTAGGGFSVARDADEGPRPNFDQMRSENWHMSTIDALEASVVTRDKVHFELTFTRWHQDGTRYWTVPALWIVTRAGDHWGIQVRSLMPATLDAGGQLTSFVSRHPDER